MFITIPRINCHGQVQNIDVQASHISAVRDRQVSAHGQTVEGCKVYLLAGHVYHVAASKADVKEAAKGAILDTEDRTVPSLIAKPEVRTLHEVETMESGPIPPTDN